MLMRLQTTVAIVLVALMVSVWAAPTAAVGASTQQQTQRSADTARTTTVVAQPATRDERSAPITVLLVGLGAAVGVIVGVIPALVAALALGYLPPPRRRSRSAGGVLVEPPPPELEPVRPLAPAPVLLAAAEESSREPPRQGQLAILAHARHQDVYDTAYAQQLERVGALRSAIGHRRRAAPEPPNDPGPGSPAKGTP
jgi:hypothetical protein